jgi:hypothetical protein
MQVWRSYAKALARQWPPTSRENYINLISRINTNETLSYTHLQIGLTSFPLYKLSLLSATLRQAALFLLWLVLDLPTLLAPTLQGVGRQDEIIRKGIERNDHGLSEVISREGAE